VAAEGATHLSFNTMGSGSKRRRTYRGDKEIRKGSFIVAQPHSPIGDQALRINTNTKIIEEPHFDYVLFAVYNQMQTLLNFRIGY